MNMQSDIQTPAQTETVAIVMPCLNEVKTIGRCVRRARETLDILHRKHGLNGEVIVADNGSTDGSQALAEAAGARVVRIEKRGYGMALIGGILATDATYIVMGDSDCSYDFVESAPMVEKLLDGCDLCMGSRFKGEIKPGAMPWKNQHIGNPILSGILRILFRAKISDAHCGLRAFRREAFDQLRLSSTGMEFASEMVLKAVLQRLRIEETPITLYPDGRDRPPHLKPWRDGMRHLIYMLLLSPAHLFLFPATILFVLGLTLMVLLLAAGNQNVWLGGIRFGDHWAVVAGAALIVSVQTAITGIFALLYSYRQGYRKPSARFRTLLRWSRLENWVLTGILLIISGCFWAGSITFGWISSDFGALDQMRNMIAAATVVVAGCQIFFSGFLMSILAGNRAAHFDSVQD